MGTSVPFSVRAPVGAHSFFPIMAQDFSLGRLVGRMNRKWLWVNGFVVEGLMDGKKLCVFKKNLRQMIL